METSLLITQNVWEMSQQVELEFEHKNIIVWGTEREREEGGS